MISFKDAIQGLYSNFLLFFMISKILKSSWFTSYLSMTASGSFSFFIFNTYVRWLWGVNKTFFIWVRPTCFRTGSSLFWLRPSIFGVRSSHFRLSPSHFFSQSFHFSTQTFPFFWVSPSHFRSQFFSFFDSDLLILRVSPSIFSKSGLLIFRVNFYLIILSQFLIRRCLTWDVNRKYIFQWRNWFRGDINKLFLCRVYVHWSFRIFKCVPWTPN